MLYSKGVKVIFCQRPLWLWSHMIALNNHIYTTKFMDNLVLESEASNLFVQLFLNV